MLIWRVAVPLSLSGRRSLSHSLFSRVWVPLTPLPLNTSCSRTAPFSSLFPSFFSFLRFFLPKSTPWSTDCSGQRSGGPEAGEAGRAGAEGPTRRTAGWSWHDGPTAVRCRGEAVERCLGEAGKACQSQATLPRQAPARIRAAQPKGDPFFSFLKKLFLKFFYKFFLQVLFIFSEKILQCFS